MPGGSVLAIPSLIRPGKPAEFCVGGARMKRVMVMGAALVNPMWLIEVDAFAVFPVK
jgi:hypothetical protein